MASNYIQAQGFPSTMKYPPTHSKTPLKTTVKMPAIHSTLLKPLLQNSSRLRDLSVGSEKKGYTPSFRSKMLPMAEHNVLSQMNRFAQNGSTKKIAQVNAEEDSKRNQTNRFNYSVIDEENRRMVHLQPIEHLTGKNENSFLLDARGRGNSHDQYWAADKSMLAANNRIRKAYLPSIFTNTSILDEGNSGHIANNSVVSRYQPSPLQKRIKSDRANSTRKVMPRKLHDPTPIRSNKKIYSPSPENNYRLEVAHTINPEKVERVLVKGNSNLLFASFDQETSYEGSQKTDRSVQNDNYKAGRYGHRHKRPKRNRSRKLEIEALFSVHSNQSLDDEYEKLNKLTNRNSKAREALLKIQESVFELKAEDKYSKKLFSNRSKDGSLGT